MFNGLLTGEPIQVPKNAQGKTGNLIKQPGSDTLDVRDLLTGLVGKNYTSLSDQDARDSFAVLSGLVGVPTARKLFDRISIYNQDPHTKNLPLNQRVQQFYDVSSGDNEVDAILQQARNFSTGPIAGMNNSPNVLNQQLTGRLMPGMLGMGSVVAR